MQIFKKSTFFLLLALVMLFPFSFLAGCVAENEIAENETEETTQDSPVYTSYATLYIAYRTNPDYADSITSGDLVASQPLTDAYCTLFQSDKIQKPIHEAIAKVYPQAEYELTLTALENGILKLAATGEDPTCLTQICQLAFENFNEQVENIVEGSSLKMLQKATEPETD